MVRAMVCLDILWQENHCHTMQIDSNRDMQNLGSQLTMGWNPYFIWDKEQINCWEQLDFGLIFWVSTANDRNSLTYQMRFYHTKKGQQNNSIKLGRWLSISWKKILLVLSVLCDKYTGTKIPSLYPHKVLRNWSIWN